MQFIAYNLLRKKNEVNVYYIEDAPMIYAYPLPSPKNVLIGRLLRLKFPIYEVSKWYFSVPEKMKKTNKSIAIKLTPLDRKDKKFVDLVNFVFNYTEDQLLNTTDIFIMEECFYTDKIIKDNSDYFLYKTIKEKYPNLQFAVKLHPRTKVNRFSNEFKCIEKSTIPWEVYLLNKNMKDTIFISLSCSTALSPKILFDDEYRCMLCYRLLRDRAIRADGHLYYTDEWEKLLANITELYNQKNNIAIPNDEVEMFNILDEWIN